MASNNSSEIFRAEYIKALKEWDRQTYDRIVAASIAESLNKNSVEPQ